MIPIQWNVDSDNWITARTILPKLQSGGNVGLAFDELTLSLAGNIHLADRGASLSIVESGDRAWTHLPTLEKYKCTPQSIASATHLFRGFDLSVFDFAAKLADAVPSVLNSQTLDGIEWIYSATFHSLQLRFHKAGNHVFVFSGFREDKCWMLVIEYGAFIEGVENFLHSFVEALAVNLPGLHSNDVPGRLGRLLSNFQGNFESTIIR